MAVVQISPFPSGRSTEPTAERSALESGPVVGPRTVTPWSRYSLGDAYESVRSFGAKMNGSLSFAGSG
jgi:hypothetical protein